MDLDGLSLVCAGFGSIEEDDDGNKIGYTKAPHCLENLKDLMRFLRRDDPQTREVFKQVCKWNIVGKDLIPIIENYRDDFNLVLNAVKVFVFLTIPVDHTSSELSQQIEYLWELKSLITNSHTVPIVVSLLEKPLYKLESGDFTEEDWKLVQLVLTFFRNLLAIQDITLHQKLGGSASQIIYLRDRFLKLLFDENVMDIIIVLTQHVGDSRGFFRQDNLLMLETFHHILMGQDPEMVAKAYTMCSQAGPEANTNLDSLKTILNNERKQNIYRIKTLGRHSQFSGTFTRYTMDGSRSLQAGTPILNSHDSQLKHNKNKTLRGVSKQAVRDQGLLPSTEHSILRPLYDFVKQFLKGGYNVLMESVRVDIEKEHHAIDNSDIVVFFRVTEFIMSFQYHKFMDVKSKESKIFDGSTKADDDSALFSGDICGPVASSLNESMFLLVLSKWRQALEGLKELNNYKLLSASGSVMKTLVRMLDTVLKMSPDGSTEGRTSRILLYKLFYDQTDQGMTQFVLSLLKSFEMNKQPKSDLSDLVEMIHVIARVLEKLQADGTLRVSKKARKARPKKLENIEIGDASPIGEDDINSEIKVFINDNDQSAEFTDTCKEDLSGSHGEGNESVAELPEIKKVNSEDQKSNRTNGDCDTNQPSDCSSEEEQAATTETDFKISTLVSGFANEHIIHNFCWLLGFYKSNSVKTNYYIICMLKRICEDLELSPMLYQLSFLTTFYKILSEQQSCPSKDHENIVNFLTSLIRRMLKKMKSQPLLFVEILFWKTRRECKYISCNSMLHELNQFRDGSNTCKATGNEQFEQQGIRRSIADALGDDEADVVMSHTNYNDEAGSDDNLDSVTKTGAGREENINSWNTSAHEEAGKLSKNKKRLVLNSEMEEKIEGLYDRHKDDPGCTEIIANALGSDCMISSAQVSSKLKQLGFALPSKKRMRKLTTDKNTDQEMEGAVKQSYPTATSNSNSMGESAIFKKEIPTTKRVRALTKDQEEKIKSLYEQFKDQKRCSYMIASALDSEGTLTASQVSRKLKQLGLPTMKVRTTKKSLHQNSSDFEQNSDDETLLSLSIKAGNRKKKIKQIANVKPNTENSAAELSDGSSDDQLIIRKHGKKLQKLRDGDLTNGSSYESEVGNELDEVLEPIIGSEQVLREIRSLDNADLVTYPSAEEAQENINDMTKEEMLEDSEDDAAPMEFLNTDGHESSRRKRMVMDYEDDD